MKKIICILSLLGFAVTAYACGDDGHKTRYCDANFKDGCDNGMYVHCELDQKDSKGKVVETKTVTLDSVEYMCDGKDVLVPANYSCKNGMIVDKEGNSKRVVCAGDMLLRCENDEVVRGTQFCDESSVVYCEKGELRSDQCNQGLSCEEYEKGEKVYASCFKQSDVSVGCDGVTPYGKCDVDGALTFCTREDTSKGKTIRLVCPDRGQECRLIQEDGFGYDCTTVCTDADNKQYTAHGECVDNNMVYYCHVDEATSEKRVESYPCQNGCGFGDFEVDCL